MSGESCRGDMAGKSILNSAIILWDNLMEAEKHAVHVLSAVAVFMSYQHNHLHDKVVSHARRPGS